MTGCQEPSCGMRGSPRAQTFHDPAESLAEKSGLHYHHRNSRPHYYISNSIFPLGPITKLVIRQIYGRVHLKVEILSYHSLFWEGLRVT